MTHPVLSGFQLAMAHARAQRLDTRLGTFFRRQPAAMVTREKLMAAAK